MIVPQLLKPGNRVSVIAPSGIVRKERVEKGIELLEAWGLTVERGKHLYDSEGSFAGNDDARLSDLQDALDDESIGAIFCARGGYGMSRIVDRIDPSGLLKRPKWIIGYSDITILHLWVNSKYELVTIHGEMVSNFNIDSRTPASIDSLQQLLFTGVCRFNWENDISRDGIVNAIVAGGNLSLITSLTGTSVREWLKGKILFIEDTGEYIYRIDRMMMDLRMSGILEELAGLVVGGFTGMTDTEIPFGKEIEEIIMESVSGYSYPIAFGLPAGHIHGNRAFFLGAETYLKVDKGIITMDSV